MRYEVILAPDAERDMEETYLYIAEESPDAATAWYNGCIEAVRSLARFPTRSGLAPEAAVFGLDIRHLLYRSHRILFVVRGQRVHVLHVRHASRQTLGSDAADED
jgi:plasmid stabilization system protein ParE